HFVELAFDPVLEPAPRAISNAGQIAGHVERRREDPQPAGSTAFPPGNPIADSVGFRAPVNRPVDLSRDDLGHLGGLQRGVNNVQTEAYDINARGQVAGVSIAADGSRHAFRTAPNRSIDPVADDLGTLVHAGITPPWSEGHAINDRGQVAG